MWFKCVCVCVFVFAFPSAYNYPCVSPPKWISPTLSSDTKSETSAIFTWINSTNPNTNTQCPCYWWYESINTLHALFLNYTTCDMILTCFSSGKQSKVRRVGIWKSNSSQVNNQSAWLSEWVVWGSPGRFGKHRSENTFSRCSSGLCFRSVKIHVQWKQRSGEIRVDSKSQNPECVSNYNNTARNLF